MLSVANLTKTINGKKIIDNLNFNVNKGEIFVMLGPNGAGKTTTLKLISGLLKPDEGNIEICGIDLLKEPIKAKSKIGFLYEQPFLYSKLTGREFINFILSMYNQNTTNEKFEELMHEFGILDYADFLIESYSFGMKQKLILVSILMRNPELILLDEPFFGLDPKSQSVLNKYIFKLKQEHKILLISTHILELAKRVADTIAIINNGRYISVMKREEIEKFSASSLEELFIKLTE